MIRFTTTPETLLQFFVEPRTVALNVAKGSDREIAAFLREFADIMINYKIKNDPEFQHRIGQYIAIEGTNVQNIESYFGTLTDAIMYHKNYYTKP